MYKPLATLTLQDLVQPDILANPYPLFRRLRNEAPLHQDPDGQTWIISRFADAATILSHPAFSARLIAPRAGLDNSVDPVPNMLMRQLILSDPPDHTRLRGVFARSFTSGRLAMLRAQAVETTTTLLDAADKTEIIDFIGAFAVNLPITIIGTLIGIPAADFQRLHQWSADFSSLLGGRALSAGEYLDCRGTVLTFIDYCKALVRLKQERPGEDLLSDLIRIEAQEDRLSLDELISNLILLIVAGHGTVTHLIGNGLIALQRHPEQWAVLRSDPDIAPAAATELLRYDGPVQTAVRDAAEDVAFGDAVIRKGQRVVVILNSANRDEERFADPDRLDFRRTGSRMLGFGHGIHTCLGAALARMEAQIAFAEIARRFPSLRVETDAPAWMPNVNFRGVETLPVRLGREATS